MMLDVQRLQHVLDPYDLKEFNLWCSLNDRLIEDLDRIARTFGITLEQAIVALFDAQREAHESPLEPAEVRVTVPRKGGGCV